jgi:hypothetical protein
MREYYLTLDNCFKNGLRPTKSMPKSSQFMSYLLNARPSEVGLEPFIPTIKNLSYTFAWPFPQMFVTNKHVLVGDGTSLSEDGTAVVADVSSELWEVISYYDFVIAARDGKVFKRDPSTGVYTTYSTYQSTFPIFKTGCDFRGQTVVGNLTLWPTADAEAKPNWVAASNIGEFDFSLSRKNESMLRPCHWEGEVFNVRPLKKVVIVYGDDGIAGLYPSEQYLGYEEIANFGIHCKGAVGVGTNRHVFLGSDMKLRMIDQQMNMKLLGFEESMSLLGNKVLISNAGHNDDFFICDGVRCFVLAGERLYECSQLITSCRSYGSETLSIYHDTGIDYFLGVTDTIDFGLRTMKTITTIELGIGAGTYSVALDWRNDSNSAFQRTSFVPVNAKGVATIFCTAVDFRVCIKCADYEDLDLSYATVRYKLSDMTSIRGVYAPPPRGQDVS